MKRRHAGATVRLMRLPALFAATVQDMSLLTIAQIDEKIRIAQESYDRAESEYDRNVSARIKSEYEHYRTERLKKDAERQAKLEQR